MPGSVLASPRAARAEALVLCPPGSAWELVGQYAPAQVRLVASGYAPSAVTTDSDLSAAGRAKRTAALLRDARSVQRRLDSLAAVPMTADDPSLRLVAEARAAAERLVIELTYRERGEQRRARRTGPWP